MLETALGILDAALAHRTGEDALQGRRLRLFGGLQIVHPIQRGTDDFGHRAPEIIVVQLLRVGTVDGDGNARNAGAGDRHYRGGPRLAPALAREILFRAEAGEQDARGLDARQIGEQQCLARAPRKVAARQQFFQFSGGRRVDALRLARQLPLLENAEDDAVHGERCQSLGPDLKLHSLSPLVAQPVRFTCGT